MENNERSNEAEALFATKRKQQQAEEAERKRLEELEQQKRQMAEEVKRLEALQATQRAQEARMAWEAQQAQQTQWAQQPQQAQQTQWAQQPQQAQQTYGVPGTGAAPTGEKKGLDPKKKKIILIGALAALAVVALAVVLILVLGSKSKPEEPSEASAEDLEKYVAPYYGMWEYDEYDTRIGINADDTWAAYDAENDRINGGVYYWEDGKLVLEDAAGDIVISLSLGSDDRLYDSDGDALFRWSGGSNEDGDDELTPFYGTWRYVEFDDRLGIYEDGTWSMSIEDKKELVHAGYYEWEDGQLALFLDDGELIGRMSLGANDRLIDPEGNAMFRYGGSSTSWFEDHGIYVNYHYGDPAITVSSGFSFEDKDNHSYARIPAKWTVEQSSRQSTGDGSCVITLVATLTTDGNNVPAFALNGNFWYNYNIFFCDYYTGLYLPEAKKGTLYSYSYEANGETVYVECSYTTDKSRTEDYSFTIVATATVRMPEDYDGLVIACTDTARTLDIYNDQWRKVINYDTVCPLDEFTDWQDFASGLICKINE